MNNIFTIFVKEEEKFEKKKKKGLLNFCLLNHLFVSSSCSYSHSV